ADRDAPDAPAATRARREPLDLGALGSAPPPRRTPDRERARPFLGLVRLVGVRVDRVVCRILRALATAATRERQDRGEPRALALGCFGLLERLVVREVLLLRGLRREGAGPLHDVTPRAGARRAPAG